MAETILGGEQNGEAGIQQESTVQEQPVQQQAVPELTFDRMVGADGALNDGWKNLLPEEIRNEPCLNNVKHIGAFAKNYVNAQKAIGANKIPLPGENASPEEWDAVFNALGRPEAADRYEFKAADDLPDGMQFDEALMKNFREAAYKLGLNQTQYNALVNYQAKLAGAQVQAMEQQAEQEYHSTLQKLTGEFGANLNTVIAQCNKAVETFGLRQVLEEKGLMNNYDVIKALAGIGERISESRLKGNPALDTAEDAQSRLNSIMGNMDDPYYKREHPQHGQRVREVAELAKRINEKVSPVVLPVNPPIGTVRRS